MHASCDKVWRGVTSLGVTLRRARLSLRLDSRNAGVKRRGKKKQKKKTFKNSARSSKTLRTWPNANAAVNAGGKARSSIAWAGSKKSSSHAIWMFGRKALRATSPAEGRQSASQSGSRTWEPPRRTAQIPRMATVAGNQAAIRKCGPTLPTFDRFRVILDLDWWIRLRSRL